LGGAAVRRPRLGPPPARPVPRRRARLRDAPGHHLLPPRGGHRLARGVHHRADDHHGPHPGRDGRELRRPCAGEGGQGSAVTASREDSRGSGMALRRAGPAPGRALPLGWEDGPEPATSAPRAREAEPAAPRRGPSRRRLLALGAAALLALALALAVARPPAE